MSTHNRITALVGLSAIMIGACTAQQAREGNDTEPPPEHQAKSLEGAAIYECDGGAVLQVRFNYDPPGATVLTDSTTFEMPLSERAEVETYALDDVELAVGPGDAQFTREGKAVSCRGVSRAVPPPAIQGAVLDLRDDNAGEAVDVEIGSTLSVSLVGVPTAGYEWAPRDLPDFLRLVDEAGGATSTAQFLPGYTGGNHWEVLAFEAVAAGSGELLLEQRRPWEDDAEEAVDTFSVTVTAR